MNQNRTALVTGASRGIGRAIALALAQRGFKLALHYRSGVTEAKEVAQTIRAAGGAAHTFAADLRIPDQVDALVREATQHFGEIHTLVANAGILKSQLLAFTKLEDWREVMAANLDSAFLLTKALARPMARRRCGRIIYISSDAGLMGDLMRAAYSASKAGILGLAKTAARELAASNVTVNVVAPGIIATDMTADIPDTRRAKQLEAIAMGRFGAPEEVAACVAFLASEEAGWITGQTLCVDGGLNMKGT